ncbi:sigma-70 family RNA polymerase sigma factor [Herbiconiux sp. SYSU D00978]|uniref:sigma-70 family RNA polymerase sigma factor n=1 Tax=Herbiconiux sp. SYSU D00978 TaxID=2812562 RepID=UPI001A95BF7A
MDRRERNALVVENLPLVGYLVSEVAARATHLSRDDLASAGSLALITAADSFDDTLGVPFGAYARRRIVGALADEMRANDWAGRGTRKRIKETLAVQDTLTHALGRTPTVDEIAESLGVDRDTAKDTLTDAARTVTTLDEVDTVLVSRETMPEESALQAERLRHLRAALEALPEKMRYIVEQIYVHDRPVGEIADELGVTHSAVSQQRTQAMKLMRDGLTHHYGDEGVPAPAAAASTAARTAYLARLAENALLRLGPRTPLAAGQSVS